MKFKPEGIWGTAERITVAAALALGTVAGAGYLLDKKLDEGMRVSAESFQRNFIGQDLIHDERIRNIDELHLLRKPLIEFKEPVFDVNDGIGRHQ